MSTGKRRLNYVETKRLPGDQIWKLIVPKLSADQKKEKQNNAKVTKIAGLFPGPWTRQRSDQMTSMLKMMVVIMITKLRKVLIMKMWVMISPMTMMILSARCEISDHNEDNVAMRMMVTQMILSASYQMRNI